MDLLRHGRIKLRCGCCLGFDDPADFRGACWDALFLKCADHESQAVVEVDFAGPGFLLIAPVA